MVFLFTDQSLTNTTSQSIDIQLKNLTIIGMVTGKMPLATMSNQGNVSQCNRVFLTAGLFISKACFGDQKPR